ncbi:hypothetical protein LSTR_LSTR005900 [Laodelphax striatellus]|uniref:Uncharacterized protein n=1 Tax=Laodelphax striatellus TaxID=195883 RepID=A0A482WRC2_LAOST|nr:hypothetical protein LSTR_LSTR005900 [Laodelphax striatellus]
MRESANPELLKLIKAMDKLPDTIVGSGLTPTPWTDENFAPFQEKAQEHYTIRGDEQTTAMSAAKYIEAYLGLFTDSAARVLMGISKYRNKTRYLTTGLQTKTISTKALVPHSRKIVEEESTESNTDSDEDSDNQESDDDAPRRTPVGVRIRALMRNFEHVDADAADAPVGPPPPPPRLQIPQACTLSTPEVLALAPTSAPPSHQAHCLNLAPDREPIVLQVTWDDAWQSHQIANLALDAISARAQPLQILSILSARFHSIFPEPQAPSVPENR